MSRDRFVHTFSYLRNPKSKDREVLAYHRRDDAAGVEVLRGLMRLGFRAGESLLNAPPSAGARQAGLHPVDLTGVRPDDLILLTTRPPIHDLHQGDRKKVLRGCTDLEACIFDVVGHYVQFSARTHLELRPEVAERLPEGHAGLADVEFLQRRCAPICGVNAHDGRGSRRVKGRGHTVLVLLRVDHMWDGGPGLVCAYGMDGMATLAWCYRLGHDLVHLLEHPRFLVARAAFVPAPPRATRLTWAEDWGIETALDLPLGPDAPRTCSPQESRQRGRAGR